MVIVHILVVVVTSCSLVGVYRHFRGSYHSTFRIEVCIMRPCLDSVARLQGRCFPRSMGVGEKIKPSPDL